jgi:hypothetical protein
MDIRGQVNKIINAVQNDELQAFGACQYEDAYGKCCAIGYLMTPEQRAMLIEGKNQRGRRLNQTSINDPYVVAAFGGASALEKAIGIPLGLAADIQSAFDEANESFVDPVSGFVNAVEALCADYGVEKN